MFAARLLGCEGDDNASAGSVGGVVAVNAYMGGIHVVRVFWLVQVTC